MTGIAKGASGCVQNAAGGRWSGLEGAAKTSDQKVDRASVDTAEGASPARRQAPLTTDWVASRRDLAQSACRAAYWCRRRTLEETLPSPGGRRGVEGRHLTGNARSYQRPKSAADKE